jgi:hypothetical protein
VSKSDLIMFLVCPYHMHVFSLRTRHTYCPFHCEISASVSSLNLFTLGGWPVATPFASSTKLPNVVLFETAYVAVLAFTRMMPMRGSSGPPSCLPSPRSPIQAFSAGE